jgi:hypothetical protein
MSVQHGVGGQFGHHQGGIVGQIRGAQAPHGIDREMTGRRGRVAGQGEGARRGGSGRGSRGRRGWPSADYRAVQPAHLGERLQVGAAADRAGRVAAEQRERVPLPE